MSKLSAIHKIFLITVFSFVTCTSSLAAETVIVYKSDALYHYRIPAITANTSKKITNIYAFAEKRIRNTNNQCGDSGEIDIVMKTSSDKGVHWSSESIVAGNIDISTELSAKNAYTNPTVLYQNNRLHLIFNTHLRDQCASTKNSKSLNKLIKGDRKFWYMYSSDEGKSWSKATQILIPTELQDRVDMVGPGNGITTKDGRIIFPASGKNIMSDDSGKSWSVLKMLHGGSESTVVELCSGQLMRNDRPGFSSTKFLSASNTPNNRVYSIGNSEGTTWSDWQAMHGIIMPVNPWVQASLIKLGCTQDNKTILAFSTPNHPKSREKMSVFISEDSGITWYKKQQFTKGKSDYSSLTKLSNHKSAILYEDGYGADSIKYSSFSIEKLK